MSYVTNIANFILARLSDRPLLNPEVYTAIAEWEKREIPPAIVLTSIDEVCELGLPVETDQFHEVVIRNFRTWLAQGTATRH